MTPDKRIYLGEGNQNLEKRARRMIREKLKKASRP